MIKRVRLKNWKSHFESEFDFSSGVNVLVGKMGSGKSSVLDAVCFALFGTTPAHKSRKVKLDNLIRRNPSPADKAVVEIEFKLDGVNYSVMRKIVKGRGTKQAELRKEGELIESPSSVKVTDQVEQILEMDFDLFSRAIYSEQDNLDYFLNLRAGKRKKEIDELLQLNKFEQARKNAVKVKNRFKDLKTTRKSDFDSLDMEDELDEIPELEKQLEQAKSNLKGIKNELKDKKNSLEEKKDIFSDLKERKNKYDKLKEERTQVKSDLNSIKDRISEEFEQIAIDPSDLSREEIKQERKEIQEKLKEIKQDEKKVNKLKQKLAKQNSLLDRDKKELKQLKENKDKLDRLKEVSDKLEVKESERKEIERSIQDLKTKKKELEEHIEPLKQNISKCPVCGSSLDQEKRDSLLKERKDKIEQINQRLSKKSSKLTELSQGIRELEEKKEDLVEYKNIENKIKDKQSTIEQTEKKIDHLENQISEFEEKLEEKNKEKLKEKSDDLKLGLKVKRMEKNKDKLKGKLNDLEKNLEEIEFDQEKLEGLREEKNQLEKKIEVLKNDKGSKKQLIKEKNKRLNSLKQKKEKREDLKDKIKKYEIITDFLVGYESALEQTQLELRERFIKSLNKLMDDIWQKVYPYHDYSSIRLNVDSDYNLELLNEEKEWISVEGQVSGGERHTAALSLRVALSLILSPALKVLILDEPTHNLDNQAIEDLGKTMKTKVSDLIDQLFLVTHEERLETAVTGNYYKLRKKGTDNGLTKILETAEM